VRTGTGPRNKRLDNVRYVKLGVSLTSDDWRAKAGEEKPPARTIRADLNYLLAKGGTMWRRARHRNNERREPVNAAAEALCCVAVFG